MTATFSQVFIQVVFSVKSHKNLIPQENLEEVFEYIAGIIRSKGHNPIVVGGVSNHVHIFAGFGPGSNISGFVRYIKNNSANFINRQEWMQDKFTWQNGFGVFSYGF